jgi:tetratricopeptide (TPR) repeat protein
MRNAVAVYAVLAAIAAALPAMSLAISPALAASERDRNDCNTDDPPRMIRGWTAVIEDAGETATDRGLALYKRGFAYIAKGEIDRAIADYDEAIRLDPNSGAIFNERGIAYKARGDFDRAIADLTEGIRLAPGNADIYYNRGNTRIEKGELAEAIADYDNAIRLGPKDIIGVTKDEAITRLATDRIKASYFGARAMTKSFLGRFEDAATDYTRFVQLDPDNAYGMLWLYLARARSGQPNGAAELQSNASMLKPADWPFPVVELFLGRRTAAATLATATSPDDRCEAQYYVGEWHLLRGDHSAALPALKSAAGTCPKGFNEYRLAQAELKRLGQ